MPPPFRFEAGHHSEMKPAAHCMRDLADTHYPDADRIRVVMDNLSTHTAGAL